MKKSLIVSVLFIVTGSAMAGDAKYPVTKVESGDTKYPVTKVESTKTRAEVKAELATWLADPAAQKADKELYRGGSN